MNAYDLELMPHPADRIGGDNHGWVFGLPPGITPAQWPLDPNTGYPLMHGFTLLLPPDHRCHGPEFVAISFFASAPDQNDGGATKVPGVREALTGAGPRPDDPLLSPFWEAGQAAHPRLARMQDILSLEYAVILLTQQEFDGPFCQPPAVHPLAVRGSAAPRWLSMGSAFTFHGLDGPLREWDTARFGERPHRGVGYNRGLRCTVRANDPNAGIAPTDPVIRSQGPYQQSFYWLDGKVEADNYRTHPWVEGHKPNHIGGTMQPVQQTPEFSPHYIEFEEDFGGYNFGTGNAQLDFRDMKFDWACG